MAYTVSYFHREDRNTANHDWQNLANSILSASLMNKTWALRNHGRQNLANSIQSAISIEKLETLEIMADKTKQIHFWPQLPWTKQEHCKSWQTKLYKFSSVNFPWTTHEHCTSWQTKLGMFNSINYWFPYRGQEYCKSWLTKQSNSVLTTISMNKIWTQQIMTDKT